jgi:environmental stress-induced protein Ves
MHRILTVVDGAELDLRIGSKAHRARRHKPLAFDGGAPAAASLHGSGPVRALNLIFDPVAVRAHVEVGRLDGRTSLATEDVAVALGGDLSVGGFGLAPFDTVLSGSPPPAVHGRGLLARITVGPRV